MCSDVKIVRKWTTVEFFCCYGASWASDSSNNILCSPLFFLESFLALLPRAISCTSWLPCHCHFYWIWEYDRHRGRRYPAALSLRLSLCEHGSPCCGLNNLSAFSPSATQLSLRRLSLLFLRKDMESFYTGKNSSPQHLRENFLKMLFNILYKLLAGFLEKKYVRGCSPSYRSQQFCPFMLGKPQTFWNWKFSSLLLHWNIWLFNSARAWQANVHSYFSLHMSLCFWC